MFKCERPNMKLKHPTLIISQMWLYYLIERQHISKTYQWKWQMFLNSGEGFIGILLSLKVDIQWCFRITSEKRFWKSYIELHWRMMKNYFLYIEKRYYLVLNVYFIYLFIRGNSNLLCKGCLKYPMSYFWTVILNILTIVFIIYLNQVEEKSYSF